MNLTLSNLTDFIIKLDRSDIKTADALFVKMTKDRAAADMIKRLLYWFPKSVKFGGWVYKSWRDWSAECGISQAQIKRVHKYSILEQFGFTRKLMKANGAPTTHYIVDANILIDKIAYFLNVSKTELESYLDAYHHLNNPANNAPAINKPKQKRLEYTVSQTDAYFNSDDSPGNENTSAHLVEFNREYQARYGQFDPIIGVIAQQTTLDPETLNTLNLNDVRARWRDLTGTLRPSYFQSIAVTMNDLILDALKGIPIQLVADEMARRTRKLVAEGHYSETYHLYRQTTFKEDDDPPQPSVPPNTS